MKTRTTHKLNAFLVFCLIVWCSSQVYGIYYKDAPKLEPYTLTRKLIHDLTQKDNKGKEKNIFRLRGLNITAKEQTKDSLILSVEADPRLNLWRGRANDLASSHLGSMKIMITSVTDENGMNIHIHDTSRDKLWSNKIVVYHLGEGIFRGSHVVRFQKTSNLAQIVGKVKLSLPVNLAKYVIKADSPESTKSLLKRDEINKVELKNGIYIGHPKSMPDFRVSIMGFNSEGERISITSAGSAGRKKDNHWYYFSKKTPFDEMLIFIPKKFADIEIPFTIDLKNT